MGSRTTYSGKKMFDDLACDFQRYCECQSSVKDLSLGDKALIIIKSPGFWPIINYRFGYWINAKFQNEYRNPFKIIFKLLFFLGRFFSVCLSKIEISVGAEIGPGLFLSNMGNIMLGSEKIGGNCTVHHNVTLGQGRDRREPTIGDSVWIGPDSVIYGGINIGDNTIIDGNTVLSRSIPANLHVGGNPCKMIEKGIISGPDDMFLLKRQE